METDKMVGKTSDAQNTNQLILDGCSLKDYCLSFQMLVDMVDTTLDDYKSDLQ